MKDAMLEALEEIENGMCHICPNELECPALLSDVVCVPWCEYPNEKDGDGDE